MIALIDARARACAACPVQPQCRHRLRIFDAATGCPRGLHATREEWERRELESIAARAWPDGAPAVSGCCDRADQA